MREVGGVYGLRELQTSLTDLRQAYQTLANKDIHSRRSPKNLTMAQASRLSIQEAELKKENDYLKMRIEQLTEEQNHEDN